MIRTLTIAVAAAAVGYAVGQRAAESPESRFERARDDSEVAVDEDDAIDILPVWDGGVAAEDRIIDEPTRETEVQRR
jgi:hypothetical protein